MTRSRSQIAALAATMLVGLLTITACTNTGNNASGQAESTLQKVVKTGVLRVGTITGNAPWESIGPDGKLQGYDIDIVNELAKALGGVKVEYTQTDLAGRVTSLQTGRVDMVVGSFTRSAERSKVIAFTDPLDISYLVTLVGVNSKYKTVADLNQPGLKIAVGAGTSNATDVKKTFNKAQPLLLPGQADTEDALANGKADATVVGVQQVKAVEKSYPGKFRVIETPVSPIYEDGIGVPLNDFAWWLYLNQFVHDINREGTAYTLYEKWFKEKPGPQALPPGAGINAGG